MNKLNIEQELDIINKKKSGISLKSLMEEFKIKSVKTIYDVIKRNGREKIIPNKSNIVNENYFENINTEEKAYWLGFLYADGYVRMKNNRSGELKLKLGIKDKEHIELFKKCLESTHIIKDIISNVMINGINHVSLCSTFSVYNTKLVKDLFNQGCINNKTFLIRMPNIDKSLIRHFIRGYFDGDGCISLNKGSASVSIASNADFTNEIKIILGYGRVVKQDNIFILCFYHKDKIGDFYHLLYDNSNIYLNRKKEIFEKHLNIIKL